MMTKPHLLITDTEIAALHHRLDPAGNADFSDVDSPVREFRTAFISDTHLGRPDSKTEKLSIFLDRARLTNKIVMHGDIIDYWLFRGSRPHHLGRIFRDDTHLRSGKKFLQFGIHLMFRQVGIDVLKPSSDETMRWEQSHNVPLQKILRILRKISGIFVPGNHDELFRGFTNDLHKMGTAAADFVTNESSDFNIDSALHKAYLKSPSVGNLDVLEEFVYQTKNGEHLHVCHGDRFDPPYKKSSTLGIVATTCYHSGVAPLLRLLQFKQTSERVRNYGNAGRTLKDLHAYYERYADFLDAENEKINIYNHHNPDKPLRPLLRGGIHGHIHNPGIRTHRGYVFIDSGDFVDDAHCSAAVEHSNGRWQIMTVNREQGIHAHPVTPEPIQLFSARGAAIYANGVPMVAATL